MIVAFDSKFLILFLDKDPKDGSKKKSKVQYLIKTLEEAKAKIIIPTPALAEAMTGAPDRVQDYLTVIERSKHFRVVPFDKRAAVEVAVKHREAILAKNNTEDTGSPWNKVKYDRQIIAIAKVEGASAIYSEDCDINKLVKNDGIEVIGLENLPLPPEEKKESLPLLDGLSDSAA